jgi:hypothetical protein
MAVHPPPSLDTRNARPPSQASETLKLIAEALARRHGQAHAERWLAEQLTKARQLPEVRRASDLAADSSRFDRVRSPRRPLDDIARGKTLEEIRSFRPPNRHEASRTHAQLAPASLEETSRRLTAEAASLLPPHVYRTYSVLHQVALEHARRRGYSPQVTHVSFGCPSEVVAHYLGIHRATLWRHRQVLHEHGLLDSRAHWTGEPGNRLSDGVIWQVKLYPGKGSAARLRYQDLSVKYRDLAADIQAGRTAWALMQQSPTGDVEQDNVARIVEWTLPPAANHHPLSMTVAFHPLETVLDLEHAPKYEAVRRELVDTGAHAIAFTLADHGAIDFYRKLLWNLLRARDYLGLNLFQALYNAVVRVRADLKEGFARSAGALLVSRLKQWSTWDEIERCSHWRVGRAPVQA